MKEGSLKESEIVELFVETMVCHNESLAEFACGDPPGKTTTKIVSWLSNLCT